jgi:hypothetical protein
MSIFFFVAISSSVMAIRLTTRPGISSELRKSFAYGRVIYLSIYTLSWVCYFEFNLYVLFLTTAINKNFTLHKVSYTKVMPKQAADTLELLMVGNAYSSLMAGIIMSLVRTFGDRAMRKELSRLL